MSVRVLWSDKGPYAREIDLGGSLVYSVDVFHQGRCIGEPTRSVEFNRYRVEVYRFSIGGVEAEALVYVGLGGPQLINVKIFARSRLSEEELARTVSRVVEMCLKGVREG